jgi:hypothetical protein
MQNDIQQGAVNLQVSVVVDQTQLAKFIHAEARPRSCRADHFREHFLADLGNNRLRLSRTDLVPRAGFKNVAKGLRRLDELCAGDMQSSVSLIRGLPAALELPTEAIDDVVHRTEQQLEETAATRRGKGGGGVAGRVPAMRVSARN